MYYTYTHRFADTGEVFYVGMAQRKDRLKTAASRSVKWKEATHNRDWFAEIVSYWATDKEASVHEQWLIDCFLDMNHPLVNIDRNLASCVRAKWTQETIDSRREALSNSGLLGGSSKSKAKQDASRSNGKLGGRPKGSTKVR